MTNKRKNLSQVISSSLSKCSIGLIAVVLLLAAIGLMMGFNTTSANLLDKSLSSALYAPFIRQAIYAFLSFGIAYTCYRLGYQTILRWSFILYIGLIVCLILVLIPGVGCVINGSSRWLKIGGFTFQPSEMMKILIPFVYVDLLLRVKGEVKRWDFLKIFGMLAPPLVLVILEPDNGSVVIMLALLSQLFFISKIKWKYWALPFGIVIIVGASFASQMPHVLDRIRVYMHPEDDLLGKGHQPFQAKIAVGSGGLYGRGIGSSLQKMNYLPAARSDYLAAIYAEEVGFLGMVLLISLYMLLTFFGLNIANRSSKDSGKLIAASLTFLIAFQAFLNLGIVSTLLPNKGTNLPFFSMGGTSLLANAIALALILSVDKSEERVWAGL